MVINFECKECSGVFDCDVGTVTVHGDSPRPHFTKEIICPKCGQRSMDEVLLTESGQSQLTEATFDFSPDNISELEDEELNPPKREVLRNEVIERFGEKLELIAPAPGKEPQRKRKGNRKVKRKKSVRSR